MASVINLAAHLARSVRMKSCPSDGRCLSFIRPLQIAGKGRAVLSFRPAPEHELYRPRDVYGDFLHAKCADIGQERHFFLIGRGHDSSGPAGVRYAPSRKCVMLARFSAAPTARRSSPRSARTERNRKALVAGTPRPISSTSRWHLRTDARRRQGRRSTPAD